MFAGSDIVRKFLEEDKTTMAEFLYDFQTYCGQSLLKECQHKGKIDPGTIVIIVEGEFSIITTIMEAINEQDLLKGTLG
ncbi:hypothetical protein M422DRAFT_256174 [Sphaerobolus stellatus SS14]|uniref:Uncharacterized protein n=1 Tax=Sphaerobolus stellatus (strain SS14) TaxID=990650 RepID=A0A0C9VH66_SPHS4|nr:hypothetical protein M422DRAFT_256174 [Sphaerobolus stellatus SS14]